MGLRARCAALIVVAGVTVTGCGLQSSPRVPEGVDGLTIPTPDPQQDDYVADIDNPYLPLQRGATWTYVQHVGEQSLTVDVSVDSGPDVAGVATTAVTTTTSDPSTEPSTDPSKPGPGVVSTTLDFYAQDDVGNVWWFGRDGDWEAGVDGAEAGLAMAARPRVGDGYRLAGLEGQTDDRLATVLAVGEQGDVEGQIYQDLVVVQTTVDGEVADERYAPGTGLVQRDPVSEATGLDRSLGLLEHDEPSD